jgi:lipopolysaccharide transport system ATP-binding protein
MIAIKIENLSKQYRLGLVSTRTLSHDLNRWWQTNILGKEDPYLKIGESNDLERERRNDGTRERESEGAREQVNPGTPEGHGTPEQRSEYIWALKDINLEVEQGEVLGIIGKNGAGKSTLLKILSKVTAPTTGTIKARGRIASLLEIGTGFHPEMTGRENIFMNGVIMGMTKAEIRARFDEIVDFAGVERYIDTPVKRYSSGMMVRLGFAVAAHLEPEILVVDEVLAVGDAEFQKKAIGKMQDISKGQGRTVLFVSHNMAAVNDLCNRAILLTNGSITADNFAKNVVVKYLSVQGVLNAKNEWIENDAPGNEYIKLRKAYIVDSEYNKIDHAFINQKIGFSVEYEVLKDVPFFTHGINVFNSMETHLFTSHDDLDYTENTTIKKGFYRTTTWIPADLLQNERIEFSFACMRYNPFDVLFHEKKLLSINVLETKNTSTRNENYKGELPGLIRPKLSWEKRIEIGL